MSPSTNTNSGSIENTNLFTEATTLTSSPFIYLTQTDFVTTIKQLLASFNYNNAKQNVKVKESIAKQDTKADEFF